MVGGRSLWSAGGEVKAWGSCFRSRHFRPCGPGLRGRGAKRRVAVAPRVRGANSIGFRSRHFRPCGPSLRGRGAKRRVAVAPRVRGANSIGFRSRHFRPCGPGLRGRGAKRRVAVAPRVRGANSIGFRSRHFRPCGPGLRGRGAKRRVALLPDGCRIAGGGEASSEGAATRFMVQSLNLFSYSEIHSLFRLIELLRPFKLGGDILKRYQARPRALRRLGRSPYGIFQFYLLLFRSCALKVVECGVSWHADFLIAGFFCLRLIR